jgi:hypothetical protein
MIDRRAIAVTTFALALCVADGASARSGAFSHASQARVTRGGWWLHGFRQHFLSNGWYDDGSWYGTSEPEDDYAGSELTPDHPRVSASSTITSRPPCHWEAEPYIVPSEAHGETKVTVMRCVSAGGVTSEGVVGRRTIPSLAH